MSLLNEVTWIEVQDTLDTLKLNVVDIKVF